MCISMMNMLLQCVWVSSRMYISLALFDEKFELAQCEVGLHNRSVLVHFVYMLGRLVALFWSILLLA